MCRRTTSERTTTRVTRRFSSKNSNARLFESTNETPLGDMLPSVMRSCCSLSSNSSLLVHWRHAQKNMRTTPLFSTRTTNSFDSTYAALQFIDCQQAAVVEMLNATNLWQPV